MIHLTWLHASIAIISLVATARYSAAEPKAPAHGEQARTLRVGNWERHFTVYVPVGYDAQKQLPVVIMLHGGGGSSKGAIFETGWCAKADKEGFLAVFPNALARNPDQPSNFVRNPQLWNDGSDRFYTGQDAPDDVAFLNAMLDDLLANFALDSKRVYVTGFSNGASMTFRFGAEAAKRLAAIAPIAGTCWPDPLTVEPPISMCYIAGTTDPLNPLGGGVPRLPLGANEKTRSKAKPPVKDSILKWTKATGCAATPASASEVGGVRTETYGPGRDGAEVLFITVEELGHTWAGGVSLLPESFVGKTSKKINDTDVIWEFFRKHPAR
jgi:polyhydroxybutyrate depolymerase